MLQFVSNQVGDFPDLFEEQIASAGSLQNGTAARPAAQTAQPPKAPQTPQASTPTVYQSSSVGLTPTQTLAPQSLPLTPPLTPVQTPPTTSAPSVPQQVTRTPPLLQPRPQTVQPIQPQPTTQTAIQVTIVVG